MKNKYIKNTEDLARVLKSAVLTDSEKTRIKSELLGRLGPEVVRKSETFRLTSSPFRNYIRNAFSAILFVIRDAARKLYPQRYSDEAATKENNKIAKTLRDTADSANHFVAPSRNSSKYSSSSLRVLHRNRPVSQSEIVLEGATRSILTNLFYKRMPLFLALAVLFSGGASLAAEGSLPGGLLYPLKVGVNERVGEVLAFSTEAKAEYEAKLAIRRAEEMERLSEKGAINPEVAERLKANFEARAEKAGNRIDELEAKGKFGAAVELNAKFKALMDRKISIFSDKVDEDGDESNKEEFRKFSMRINGEKDKLASAQARVEAKLKTETPAGFQQRAEGKMKAAENKLAEVTKFIESQKENVSAEVYASAEAKLASSNELMVEGRAKLEAGEPGEAFILFNQVFVSAMEAKDAVKEKAEKARRVGIGIGLKAKVDIGDDSDNEASDEDEEEDGEEDDEDEEENENTSASVGVNVSVNI